MTPERAAQFDAITKCPKCGHSWACHMHQGAPNAGSSVGDGDPVPCIRTEDLDDPRSARCGCTEVWPGAQHHLVAQVLR